MVSALIITKKNKNTMTKEEIEDCQSTINWLLKNGDFKDTKTAFNIAINSFNTLDKALTIPVVSFSKPAYKDKNQLPDDIKYLFHKGVNLYQKIMDYERGIIGLKEFIAEMRKVDKAY